MQTSFLIENITYRRKTVDKGVLLRHDRYISVKLDNGVKISKKTPQKASRQEYFSIYELDQGDIFVIRKTLENSAIETTYKVKEITEHNLYCEEIETKKKAKQGRKIKDIDFCVQTGDVGIFTPGYDLDRETKQPPCTTFEEFEKLLNIPEELQIIEHKSKKFQKKTAFYFVYDPENKKKTGSKYKRVQGVKSMADSNLFAFKGDSFDVLTGWKIPKYLSVKDVRDLHFQDEKKPSPRYKQITQGE